MRFLKTLATIMGFQSSFLISSTPFLATRTCLHSIMTSFPFSGWPQASRLPNYALTMQVRCSALEVYGRTTTNSRKLESAIEIVCHYPKSLSGHISDSPRASPPSQLAPIPNVEGLYLFPFKAILERYDGPSSNLSLSVLEYVRFKI